MITYLKLFLTATFWGGTWIAGKVVAQNMGPFSAAFLRFAIGSSILLLVTRKVEGRLPPLKRNHFIPITLLGLTGVFAYNYFFFNGLKFIDAGRASLIAANNPIFITVLSFWIFKEQLNWKKYAGILLSVLGAMIVICRGDFLDLLNGNLGWGEFYIFCSVLSWVTYSLVGKSVMAELSPIVTVSYSAIVGTVTLLVPAYYEGVFRDLTHFSQLEWLSICYLAVFGTVLGFLWYYEGIKKIGPSRASQFINFVPVTAVLLAFLLLDEAITLSLAVGAALVITGVYLTNSFTFGKR